MLGHGVVEKDVEEDQAPAGIDFPVKRGAMFSCGQRQMIKRDGYHEKPGGDDVEPETAREELDDVLRRIINARYRARQQRHAQQELGDEE